MHLSIHPSIDRFISCLSLPSPSPYHTDQKDAFERALSDAALKPLYIKRQREFYRTGKKRKTKLLHGWMQQEKTGLRWNIICSNTKTLPEQLFCPSTILITADVWVISTRALKPTSASWGLFNHSSFTTENLVCAMLYFVRKKLSWGFLYVQTFF